MSANDIYLSALTFFSVLCSVPGVCMFVSTSWGRQPNHDENNYESLHVNTTAKLLWPRLYTWLRQIWIFCSFVLIVTEISSSCNEAVAVTCYVSSWQLVTISAIYTISLLGDSPDTRASINWKIRILWVPVYVVNALYLVISHIEDKNARSSAIVGGTIFAVGGAIFSIIAAVQRRPKVLTNAPTKEYTAGLLSYLTFSYINKELIGRGMNKESLELEDVPGLNDDDSCALVYKVNTMTKISFQVKYYFPVKISLSLN